MHTVLTIQTITPKQQQPGESSALLSEAPPTQVSRKCSAESAVFLPPCFFFFQISVYLFSDTASHPTAPSLVSCPPALPRLSASIGEGGGEARLHHRWASGALTPPDGWESADSSETENKVLPRPRQLGNLGGFLSHLLNVNIGQRNLVIWQLHKDALRGNANAPGVDPNCAGVIKLRRVSELVRLCTGRFIRKDPVIFSRSEGSALPGADSVRRRCNLTGIYGVNVEEDPLLPCRAWSPEAPGSQRGVYFTLFVYFTTVLLKWAPSSSSTPWWGPIKTWALKKLSVCPYLQTWAWCLFLSNVCTCISRCVWHFINLSEADSVSAASDWKVFRLDSCHRRHQIRLGWYLVNQWLIQWWRKSQTLCS